MKQTFYSNGKLLLTGEYTVLDGAIALALPTIFGQFLYVEEGKKNTFSWKSHDKDGSVWFEDEISFDAVKNKSHTTPESTVRNTLIDILHQAYRQNPDFIENSNGYKVTTTLTFPRFWGLGTSSTLINNIAQWVKIDAFELLRESFGGSGYDIACAQNDTPILYQLEGGKTFVKPVTFQPEFFKNIFFVYLNQKQSSKTAINTYRNKRQNIENVIPQINKLTAAAVKANNSNEFSEIMQSHEIIMSHVLEMQTAKEALFPDFKGVIKSLGAWGGDFVMVISEENPEAYFKERSYHIVIPYVDMIK